MEFKIAGRDDIASLISMRMAYLAEDYGDLPEEKRAGIERKLPDYFQRHLNVDLFAFVCTQEAEVVSCCFLYVCEKPANPTFPNGKTGAVLNVYTKPEYRRKGIAGKLLKMLLAQSEKMGLDFVELKATNAGFSLYQSLGFEDAVSKYHNMKYVITPE